MASSVGSVVLSVLMVFLAKVATVFSGGAAAPLVVGAYLMLASSLVGLSTQIAQESGLLKVIGDEMIAPLLEAGGMTPEKAKSIASMIIGISAAIIQIALGIAGAVISGRADVAIQVWQMMTRFVSVPVLTYRTSGLFAII